MRRCFTSLFVALLASVAAFAGDVTSMKEIPSPAISLVSDDSQTTRSVEIIYPLEGAEIYFTLDGTEPNDYSFRYDGTPIVINGSVVIKAIAIMDGVVSDVTTATYAVDPSGIISTLFSSLVDIYGGNGTITVTGTDDPSEVTVSTLFGRRILVDEDRSTTIKGAGDTPDCVIVDMGEDKGIFAVKSSTTSKLVIVF